MNYNYDFCPVAFQEMEIFSDGNVYLCCPSWNEYYSVGNVFENSVEEVWNSEKAIELRKRILNNDYSLCKKDRCFMLHNKNFYSEFKGEFTPIMEASPLRVKYGYDYECNIACSICRDKIKKLSDEELKKWDEKIDSFFIPILKSTKILVINTHGDPFGSRHSRKVIQKAAQTYPDLKFDFTTNGLLCNEKMFETLSLNPSQIDTIRVSIHAATKETYGKIVQNGEKFFDTLLENLQFISDLKKTYNFMFLIQFVVMANNYQEMPAFVELAQKYHAGPMFWEYKKDCCAYSQWHQDLDILDPKHKDHKKLIKVLHHPNMYIYKNCLYPMLLNLQNTDIDSPIKKLFKKIFKKTILR